MKVARPFITAAVLAFALAACSQPDDLTDTPTLAPQFGTRGYDEVTDVAFGKALVLYAVGTTEARYEYRNGTYVQSKGAFVRRYDRNGNLVWENYLDLEPAYENNDFDGYVPRLTARAVAVDGNGNAFISWSSDYQAYQSNGYRVVATFNYLTKYSPNGSKLWRIYTSSALTDLAVDSSGNVYGTSDTALTKYSSGGAQVWTKTQPVTASSVAVSSSNNVYIVRWDGTAVKYSAGGTQLYLKAGQLDGYSWGGYYGGGEPYRIAAGLSDELYVTASHSQGSNEGCDAGYTEDYYTTRAYKLSSTGVRQWIKNVASGTYITGEDCSGNDYASLSGLGVAADSAGNVYIASYQDGAGQDGFVAKYSRAGALSWKKPFVTAKDDTATSVATYDGSEVFVGGVTEGFLVHRQLGGGGDAVMREVNSSGTRVWSH